MNKNIALLSYLWWPGWILAAVLYSTGDDKNAYARFHLRQSFGLGLLAVVCYGVLRITGFEFFEFSLLNFVVFVVLLLLWFLGFKSAMDETQKELPVVGKYFQQWFRLF